MRTFKLLGLHPNDPQLQGSDAPHRVHKTNGYWSKFPIIRGPIFGFPL